MVASCVLDLPYPHRPITYFQIFHGEGWYHGWGREGHGEGWFLMHLEQDTLSLREEQCPASTGQRPWAMADLREDNHQW